ncbi:SIMPL domain-containing protein [Tistrella bauzanensis]|uniref:SIMPL domain-containing protein n=1 Tax=Tistrella arctica TaxID=3133430 RepID=A0ABU9YDU2_9PROT
MRMDILGLAGAAVIAVGIAAGGWLVGQGVVEARLGNRTVSVKGLSEREVKADLAVWSLRYVASGNDLTEVLRELRGATETVTSFFTDAGLPAGNIEMLSLDVTDQNAQLYRSGPVEVRYIVAQTVAVRTTEVDKVEAASQKVGTLVEAGVVLSNEMGAFGSGPSYVFTRLNDLKPEMIAEATANARDGAAQFATDSGSRVGAIRNASQGLFQILPATDIPNMPESRQITKTVRVVSTIDFFLED